MLTDGLEWCGLLVDYCDVFITCLNSYSDGTHSLQRIHWWASDSIQNFPKSVYTKKQTHLHLRWSKGKYVFSKVSFFGWTTSLIFNNIIKLTSVTLLDENLNWTELDNDNGRSRSCSIMLLDLIILLAIICVFTSICPLLFLCFRTEMDVGACSTWNVWSASPVKSAVCSWSPQTPPSPVLSLCPSRPVCQNNKETFNSLQHLFINSNCPWILCFNHTLKRFLKDNCQVSQIFQQNWTMLRLT